MHLIHPETSIPGSHLLYCQVIDFFEKENIASVDK
jgi:hypothetical protein